MAGGEPDQNEIRNTVTGAGGRIVQAGVVHGNIHLHAADVPAVVPRQTPPPPAHFTGREPELEFLDTVSRCAEDAAPPVVVIRGAGGMGKTALALYWMSRRTDRFTDGQLYADLATPSGEPIASEDVLGQFLRALGTDPRQVPPTLTERVALYRSITANRQLAVLLDDAVSAAQARVLVPTSRQSVTVVTSRRPLLGLVANGAQLLEVAPLNTSSSLALLERRVGAGRVAAERNQAEKLADLCDGLPLALVVSAARVASRPAQPLARIVANLRDEQRRLETLSPDDELSVRSTFDISYDGLSGDGRQAYHATGIHPGSRFAVEVVAAAVRADRPDARRVTDELVDASLLTEIDDGYFQVHDLVHAHAKDRARRAPANPRTDALRRILEWYLWVAQQADRTVLPGRRRRPYEFESETNRFAAPPKIAEYRTALHWLDREQHTLATAVREAIDRSWFALACALANSMQPIFILHKDYHAETQVGELALQAAIAWGNGDAENNMRKRLPLAYTRLDQWDQAERHVNDMVRLSIERADRRGEADARYTEGVVYARRGQFGEAVAAFRRNLLLFEQLTEEPDRDRTRGIVLIELGDALTESGHPAQAIAHLTEACTVLSGLAPPDNYNLGRAEAALGRAQLRGDDHTIAATTLHRALERMADLGSPAELARIHRVLAELARHTGDTVTARRHTARSAELLEGRQRSGPTGG